MARVMHMHVQTAGRNVAEPPITARFCNEPRARRPRLFDAMAGLCNNV